jgi:hypothetical protein
VTRQNVSLVRERIVTDGVAASTENAGNGAAAKATAVYQKLIKPAVTRKYFVSDTGRLNYELMKEMLRSIHVRARATGLPSVPVVLTNHPKDIRDWEGLNRFVQELAKAKDVRLITLSELAAKLKDNQFEIRRQSR